MSLWSKITSIAATAAFLLVPVLHAQAATNDAAGSRDLVNAARASSGLAPLADDSRLDSIAQAQAQRMADRDEIYHNPNLKQDADNAGVNWQWIGENVGVGPDVQSVHDGFMASPPHHENIVYASYNAIGTGTAVGKDGSIFVAQVYAGIAPKATPAGIAPAPAKQKTVVAAVEETPQPQPKAAAVTEAPPVAPKPADVNVLFGGLVNHEMPVG